MFDLFDTTDYTFLQLESKSGGNVAVEEYSGNGVFKLRSGMVQPDNVEAYSSDATLHIRPTEAFIEAVDGEMVGHGIRITKGQQGPTEYRIDGVVEGFDFDRGTLEFYRLTLKKENLWDESELSLT